MKGGAKYPWAQKGTVRLGPSLRRHGIAAGVNKVIKELVGDGACRKIRGLGLGLDQRKTPRGMARVPVSDWTRAQHER